MTTEAPTKSDYRTKLSDILASHSDNMELEGMPIWDSFHEHERSAERITNRAIKLKNYLVLPNLRGKEID